MHPLMTAASVVQNSNFELPLALRFRSLDELKSVLRELAMDVQRGTGDDRYPEARIRDSVYSEARVE